MDSFVLNGILWTIYIVPSNSHYLIDRTGNLTVATTDPKTLSIYISDRLSGEFLNRVLIHELGHCVLFSYGLLDYIHSMVMPKFWVEVEEMFCNFIADYGYQIFKTAYNILGNEAIRIVPYELERIVA